MDELTAIRVMTQLIQVTSYLHSRQIPLENISPENTSVTKEGSPLLIDCGILHKCRSLAQRNHMTKNPLEKSPVPPEHLV